MSIIDDEHELNKILESMNIDKYELINLPLMQSGDLSHKHTGGGLAFTLDIACICMSGLAPLKGSSTKLLSGFESCQQCSLFSPLYSYNLQCPRRNVGEE